MDWKAALPTLGALATGNIPGAIATAAIAISDALGVSVPANPDAVSAAVLGATPEQMAALRKVDADLKVKLREFEVEERRISADSDKALLLDAANARDHHAANIGVMRLGYLINVASYGCVAGVLWGSFALLGAKAELKVDPGTAAMVGGIIGSAVQWLLSNAAQANGFFFGSSPSSRQAIVDLARSVSNASAGAAQK